MVFDPDVERRENMKFFTKFENKFGRYSIKNLPLIIIILYAIGYVIQIFQPAFLNYLYLSPYWILHGQIWRLVTWLVIPPYSLSIWILITLYFYYSIGRTLENTWGSFRFNVYIFSGVIFTIICTFILYAVTGYDFGAYVSTYYICMSIFLAFAVTYPNMQVLLMMIIPIKVKWLGVIYGVMIVVNFIQSGWVTRTLIFASLLNFLIYFLMTRNTYHYRPREVRRRNKFKQEVKKVQPKGETRHKCAVCGRTEKDGANLEFRYCSKCDGNYEYCQDHLFTHEHIKAGNKK